MITKLFHTLSAERLKMRRTLALALTFLIPLALILLQFAISVQRGGSVYISDGDAWIWLSQNIIVFWSLLMLPLFVTLETALLGNMEYRNETWKKLYTLPVPRWMVILAKQVIALGLIALSFLFLVLLTALMGVILNAIDPTAGLGGPPPLVNSSEIFRAGLFGKLADHCHQPVDRLELVQLCGFHILRDRGHHLRCDHHQFGKVWEILSLGAPRPGRQPVLRSGGPLAAGVGRLDRRDIDLHHFQLAAQPKTNLLDPHKRERR